MSSAKWRLFCIGLNVLIKRRWTKRGVADKHTVHPFDGALYFVLLYVYLGTSSIRVC